MVMKASTVELMDRQSDLRSAIYRAQDSAEKARLVTAYDDTVRQLMGVLGEDAPCYEVDCDLWSVYSDVFKSQHNFRPRGRDSRAQVLEALQRIKYHYIADCQYPKPEPKSAMAVAFAAALAAG